MAAEQATWVEFTSKPLIELKEFYAADRRRERGGRKSFGFDWKDPSVTQPDTFCEVYWYHGTHEIAAVYSTYDRARLAELLSHGRAAMSVIRLGAGAGPVAGPVINDAASAASLGQWLGDRDLATTDTKVRVMGALEHPLERYWALRDAFFLETHPDGLLTLQRRIDACHQAERHPVTEHPLWNQLSAWLGTNAGEPS